MFKNKANFAKNRMHLMLKGKIELDDVHAWSDDFISQLKKLKPGISVISEVAEYQPTTEEGRQVFIDTQRKAKEAGMGHVIRIILNPNFVKVHQWQRNSSSFGYNAMEAGSIEKAAKLPDEAEKFNNNTNLK